METISKAIYVPDGNDNRFIGYREFNSGDIEMCQTKKEYNKVLTELASKLQNCSVGEITTPAKTKNGRRINICYLTYRFTKPFKALYKYGEDLCEHDIKFITYRVKKSLNGRIMDKSAMTNQGFLELYLKSDIEKILCKIV